MYCKLQVLLNADHKFQKMPICFLLYFYYGSICLSHPYSRVITVLAVLFGKDGKVFPEALLTKAIPTGICR